MTSVVVQVNGNNGWAMVMDDNPDLAQEIAVLDGAYSAGICTGEIVELSRIGEKQQNLQDMETNARIDSTRVSFDLL